MLPEYWIERPSFASGRAAEAAVDGFLKLADANVGSRPLDVDAFLLEQPRVVRWQFLSGLAARRRIAFHGTGDPGIERFEPREPVDFAPFGKQRAVFATSDPIWAMFYAIVDRGRLTLNNGCIFVLDAKGRGEPYYYFSVSREELAGRPWRTGYLYFLPADTFVEQPARRLRGSPGTRSLSSRASLRSRRLRAFSVAPEELPIPRQHPRPR